MKKYSENDIIVGLLEGGIINRRRFENRLYEHFVNFVELGMWEYELSEDECASAYSDTIIVVVDNIIEGRFESKSTLKTYAYSIFANKCVDQVRKKSTKKEKVNSSSVKIDTLIDTLPASLKDSIQIIIERNDSEMLMDKIKKLNDNCRKLLLLFEEGYNDKEIAQQMPYKTPEVVKITRLRCIEKLRAIILPKKQNE